MDDELTKSQKRVQQSLIASMATSTRGPVKEDSVPFVPAAATLLKEKPEKSTIAHQAGGIKVQSQRDASRSQDMNTEKEKTQQAHDFAQRLHPDGSGAQRYISFEKQIRGLFWRKQIAAAKKFDVRRDDNDEEDDSQPIAAEAESVDLGEGSDGESQEWRGSGEGEDVMPDGAAAAEGDGGGDGSEESPLATGEHGAVTSRVVEYRPLRAKQESNPNDLPPQLQWLLREAMGESPSAAEQHNLLNYTKECTKIDIRTCALQEAAAQKQLDQLKGKEDDFSRKRYDRIKKLKAAIRGDLRRAERLLAQLESVIGTMQRKNGDRIRDGYNLIPKSRFVVASMGLEGRVSEDNLASDYIAEVLCMVNASQFFENFMLRHIAMGFEEYVEVMLKLLGNDIKSANPSRGLSQLQALREALYFAEISFQIYESIADIEQKLGRIRILMEREAGYFEPVLMKISYADNKLFVSVANGSEQPKPVATIAMSDRSDHFSALTKLVKGYFVDEIFMENCSEGRGRDLRSAVQRRYGLPVGRKMPSIWQTAPANSN